MALISPFSRLLSEAINSEYPSYEAKEARRSRLRVLNGLTQRRHLSVDKIHALCGSRGIFYLYDIQDVTEWNVGICKKCARTAGLMKFVKSEGRMIPIRREDNE
jgi:hypothetical protein